MRKKRKTPHVNPGYLFAAHGVIGKYAKPSPCPFSWWLDRDNFYALARVRAEETRGREKILTRSAPHKGIQQKGLGGR